MSKAITLNEHTAIKTAIKSEQLDHTHRGHALLSASSSKQWLNCPPSARLQERFPNESSSYAQEGTFMHEVCEYKLRHDYFHEDVPKPKSEEWYTEEVEQVTDVYYEFVVSAIEDFKKSGQEPLVLIEAKLNYTHIAPSGFGTGDMVIVGKLPDGRAAIHVIDFKGGRGVFVDADHNTQMMLYALGALAAYGYIWDIELVRMTIVQPRLDNISTFECSRAELEAWGESIKPIARMAYEGKGEQKAGDWCKFCRAKPVCKALAEEALALCREEFVDLDATSDGENGENGDCGEYDKNPGHEEYQEHQEHQKAAINTEATGATEAETETDITAPYSPDRSIPVFKQPGLIALSELEEILPILNRISSWIEAVFAYVSSEAITHVVPIKGYKVIEGRSVRTFTDVKAVVKTATDNGYTNIYKQQLITLTEFEKLMGKKRFAELLGQYIIKPPGKLSLVPESDPRPAVEIEAKTPPAQEFDVLPEQGDF
ncbi:MAG: DUF2800 domain-containing protein [Synergistaceae bacterium]|nr:DUF2800 domain-containing protein [Synergistaceae bacterium]